MYSKNTPVARSSCPVLTACVFPFLSPLPLSPFLSCATNSVTKTIVASTDSAPSFHSGVDEEEAGWRRDAGAGVGGVYFSRDVVEETEEAGCVSNLVVVSDNKMGPPLAAAPAFVSCGSAGHFAARQRGVLGIMVADIEVERRGRELAQ